MLLGSTGWAAERPNILVILADDLGYGDVRAFRRDGDVQTPHLDRLAEEGMKFTAMRANCTVCSPTRAALMTGRYPDRVGVPGVIRTNAADSWGYLDPKVPTLAERLRGAGYATALVGKWHLGLSEPNLPNQRGFDHFHGFLGDMMDSYTTHRRQGQNYLRLNGEVIDPPGHATDLFTDWACAYLRERRSTQQPFFLYLAYTAPHFPIEPPAEWLERVKRRAPSMDPKRAANVALVEHLDDAVGRILGELRGLGLEQNTLVFFTSDNGGSLPHGANNDPWRGGKQDHYEGGLRVPFIARWPGRIVAGGTTAENALTFDIFATSLAVAGQPLPAGTDAVDLMPLMTGAAASPGARELYFSRREGGPAYGGKSYEALIKGDWKLLQNDPYSPLELYNLKEDPRESKNLAPSLPAVVREMQAALRKHVQQAGATPWQPAERR